MRISCLLLAAASAWFAVTAGSTASIDLRGEWNVSLPGAAADGPIMLPGTTDMAGYGNAVDTLSLSRREKLLRLTRRHTYVGPAVYSRMVTISKDMAYKPLELNLERVIWKSSATIGGQRFGNDEYSLVAPHRHLLREGMPEGSYLLEITVDNSRQYDISTNNLAHCYTDDTQTIWNGILGDISLHAITGCDIGRLEVVPSATLDSVRIEAAVNNPGTKQCKTKISFSAGGATKSVKAILRPGENVVAATLAATGLERWNEFHPALHTATVRIGKTAKSVRFGLRSIDNKDGLRINGTPVFLRGTLECCVFPLTGTPPTDAAGWLKTFSQARSFGLNHLRFHSWCPPEAAFQVADSLGFYLQVELPVWSLKIGDDRSAQQFLEEEFERIIQNYGNHPSLCLISVGNELQHDFNWLNSLVARMKQRDPRHLYTTTSFTFEKGHGGHPEPEDEFFITQWTDNGWVRGQGVFETDPPSFNRNYDAALQGIDVPLIPHEIGQYAVYPAMSEIGKYTGTLNPLNFKNIRDSLEKKGMLGDSRAMTMASARLAAILYKEEIERALKTSGFSGFQLLGLQDFPGQGTALVGLLDAFWDNKGAVDDKWFREFCAPVVPLLNFGAAVFRATDTFEGDVMLANFTDAPLKPQSVSWSLTIEGDQHPFASGEVTAAETRPGTVAEAGHFSTPLTAIRKPSAVVVRLTTGDGSTNSWRIHVYPQVNPDHGKVLVTRSPDEALKGLREGRDVLLAPSPDSIRGIESKFLPVFWSPVHFPKQAGTMGIMCDPAHPALSGFPNAGHTDWQWWTAVKHARVVVTDSIPGITPIVRVTDNFVQNRRLAYIFEANCGNGRLIFSAIDLLNPDIVSPEIQALAASVLNYMNSESFHPAGTLPIHRLEALTGNRDKLTTTAATSIYE